MAEQQWDSPQRSLAEDIAPGGDVEGRLMSEETGEQSLMGNGNGYSHEHHHRLGPLTLDALDRVPGGHRAAETIERVGGVSVERVPVKPWAMAGAGVAAAAGIGAWMMIRARRRRTPRQRAMRAARQAGYAGLLAIGALRYAYEQRNAYADMARDTGKMMRGRYGEARRRMRKMDLEQRYGEIAGEVREQADEMSKHLPSALRR